VHNECQCNKRAAAMTDTLWGLPAVWRRHAHCRPFICVGPTWVL